MKPIIRPLQFTYRKKSTDVWVLNTSDLPIEQEKIKDIQLVHFGPLSFGGNHQHPRTEWFIGVGELLFIWLDDAGNRHEEYMYDDKKLLLFTVPPFLPHAVVNQSKDKIGLLYEMADGKLTKVKEVLVYEH